MSRPRVLAFVPVRQRLSVLRLVPVVVALLLPVVAAVLLVLPAAAPALADESQAKKDVKEFGRDVGRAADEAGKEIGRAGKEVGLEVADAAKKTWYKGREVTAPLLEDMRHAARMFWKNVLERKDETLEDLRRKNEELKGRSGSGS